MVKTGVEYVSKLINGTQKFRNVFADVSTMIRRI